VLTPSPQKTIIVIFWRFQKKTPFVLIAKVFGDKNLVINRPKKNIGTQ
jgi:hypothetical protein